MRTHPLIIQIRLFIRYLGFYIKAKTKYDVDSPFVTSFINHVLEDNRFFYAFSLIKWVRQQLLKDSKKLQITDYGAGSLLTSSNQREVRHIARHGAINDRQGRYLFKISHFYRPELTIELGTSLGISTLYFALADSRHQVISVEGSEAIAERAAETIHGLRTPNISLIQDTFDKALDKILKESPKVDLVYLDGDHRKGSSIRYFERCLPHFHEKSIMIVADIYWSVEMQTAWNQMKSHPRVSLAIDLFDFGILFFDQAIREKVDLKLVPIRYKPWRIGLFR